MPPKETRYTVRDRKALTGAKGRGQIRQTVWVVWDTFQSTVAKGTTGDGRPGGYATQAEAQQLADKMNRELAERQRNRRSQ